MLAFTPEDARIEMAADQAVYNKVRWAISYESPVIGKIYHFLAPSLHNWPFSKKIDWSIQRQHNRTNGMKGW
jgi:hypothetical protein